MNDFFQNSVYFGVVITFLSYGLGIFLKNKYKKPIFNPLLLAILFTIAGLSIFRVDYRLYFEGSKYISYLLTPATICLAVPLYEEIERMKENIAAILIGILTGVATSLGTVLLLSSLFRLDHTSYVTLLPKSITTAIGIGVSEELGGYVPLTVAVIILTGVLGNILAESLCKLFHITEPIAKGIAIGSASHAIGTSKAMEIGEIEGAMSSLSIVISGLVTVIFANLFAHML